MESAATTKHTTGNRASDPREARRIRRAERFWGNAIHVEPNARMAALAFVIAAIAGMSFTQLGFWSIGVIDGKSVYLALLLGPLAIGALFFGPYTGALLGLFAGAVVFTHASFFPLDSYEVYYMSSLTSFGLLTFIGAISGWLFSQVTRRYQPGATRMGLIAAVCTLVSALTTSLMMMNVVIMYGGIANLETIRALLLNSPLGAFVQAVVDALFMTVACLVADFILRSAANSGEERRLGSIFRDWMLLVSSIVFIVASAIIFTTATNEAQETAVENMHSEIKYLENQLIRVGAEEYESVLEGYEVEADGTVVITDEQGVIMATDHADEYPVGESLIEALGYEMYGDDAPGFLDAIIKEPKGTTIIDATGRDGVETMDFTFISVGTFDGGYIAMLRSSEMVYVTRFNIMFASTVLAFALIISIAIVAMLVLNTVVVRRIDDTNSSLGKITHGNLNVRVNVRDSREFASLSTGINTTVAALKDSIAEAEQKNAQELATAKAIQESALPREFPPFPEIDRFDIYASMKTAKEVGGDFYDFFLVDEDKLGFIIADVSGKGIPAALFMMTAKTQIRNYLEAGLPVNEAVAAANHQLCIGNDAGMFVTMYACMLNYETGELACVNAGHNPPLMLHDGTWKWMTGISGIPLGLFDGLSYDAFEHQLETGDMLYLYTDGVTEAMSEAEQLFGEDRLEDTLYTYANMNPRSVGVGVRRAITDFTKDAEQSDDITMLCLKYGVPPEKRAMMILPAVDTQLVHVYNFIHEELHRRNAPKSAYNPLDIAAEELFVNVCHYAYPDATPEDPGEVRISFVYEANPPSLTVEISDDGIPYNPLEKPDAVTPDNVMDVPIGGLGILMAKKSVDDMTYSRENGSNILTFRKGW